jgi:hypothetical protein
MHYFVLRFIMFRCLWAGILSAGEMACLYSLSC